MINYFQIQSKLNNNISSNNNYLKSKISNKIGEKNAKGRAGSSMGQSVPNKNQANNNIISKPNFQVEELDDERPAFNRNQNYEYLNFSIKKNSNLNN